jgi:hypothetical protein
MPDERPEFDLYYNDLIAALAPEGAIEAKLAEAIIMDEWGLTRARLVENQIFCRGYKSARPEDQFVSGAETWLAIRRNSRRRRSAEQRINRVLVRNKSEFESRQAARRARSLSRKANRRRRFKLPSNLSNPPAIPPPQNSRLGSFIRARRSPPASEPASQSPSPHRETTRTVGFVRFSDVTVRRLPPKPPPSNPVAERSSPPDM